MVARRGVALGSTHDSHSLSQSQSRRGGDSTSTLHGLKPKSDVCVLRWSPDGQVLAVACRDKLVHLFGKEFHYRRLGSCRGHSTAVVRMDFSADGRVLQTNDMGREMLFWDVETAKQVSTASDHCLYPANTPLPVNGGPLLVNLVTRSPHPCPSYASTCVC